MKSKRAYPWRREFLFFSILFFLLCSKSTDLYAYPPKKGSKAAKIESLAKPLEKDIVFYRWQSFKAGTNLVKSGNYSNELFDYFMGMTLDPIHFKAGHGVYIAEDLISSSTFIRGDDKGQLIEVHIKKGTPYIDVTDKSVVRKLSTHGISVNDVYKHNPELIVRYHGSRGSGWWAVKTQQGISFQPFTGKDYSLDQLSDTYRHLERARAKSVFIRESRDHIIKLAKADFANIDHPFFTKNVSEGVLKHVVRHHFRRGISPENLDQFLKLVKSKNVFKKLFKNDPGLWKNLIEKMVEGKNYDALLALNKHPYYIKNQEGKGLKFLIESVAEVDFTDANHAKQSAEFIRQSLLNAPDELERYHAVKYLRDQESKGKTIFKYADQIQSELEDIALSDKAFEKLKKSADRYKKFNKSLAEASSSRKLSGYKKNLKDAVKHAKTAPEYAELLNVKKNSQINGVNSARLEIFYEVKDKFFAKDPSIEDLQKLFHVFDSTEDLIDFVEEALNKGAVTTGPEYIELISDYIQLRKQETKSKLWPKFKSLDLETEDILDFLGDNAGKKLTEKGIKEILKRSDDVDDLLILLDSYSLDSATMKPFFNDYLAKLFELNPSVAEIKKIEQYLRKVDSVEYLWNLAIKNKSVKNSLEFAELVGNANSIGVSSRKKLVQSFLNKHLDYFLDFGPTVQEVKELEKQAENMDLTEKILKIGKQKVANPVDYLDLTETPEAFSKSKKYKKIMNDFVDENEEKLFWQLQPGVDDIKAYSTRYSHPDDQFDIYSRFIKNNDDIDDFLALIKPSKDNPAAAEKGLLKRVIDDGLEHFMTMKPSIAQLKELEKSVFDSKMISKIWGRAVELVNSADDFVKIIDMSDRSVVSTSLNNKVISFIFKNIDEFLKLSPSVDQILALSTNIKTPIKLSQYAQKTFSSLQSPEDILKFLEHYKKNLPAKSFESLLNSQDFKKFLNRHSGANKHFSLKQLKRILDLDETGRLWGEIGEKAKPLLVTIDDYKEFVKYEGKPPRRYKNYLKKLLTKQLPHLKSLNPSDADLIEIFAHSSDPEKVFYSLRLETIGRDIGDVKGKVNSVDELLEKLPKGRSRKEKALRDAWGLFLLKEKDWVNSLGFDLEKLRELREFRELPYSLDLEIARNLDPGKLKPSEMLEVLQPLDRYRNVDEYEDLRQALIKERQDFISKAKELKPTAKIRFAIDAGYSAEALEDFSAQVIKNASDFDEVEQVLKILGNHISAERKEKLVHSAIDSIVRLVESSEDVDFLFDQVKSDKVLLAWKEKLLKTKGLEHLFPNLLDMRKFSKNSRTLYWPRLLSLAEARVPDLEKAGLELPDFMSVWKALSYTKSPIINKAMADSIQSVDDTLYFLGLPERAAFATKDGLRSFIDFYLDHGKDMPRQLNKLGLEVEFFTIAKLAEDLTEQDRLRILDNLLVYVKNDKKMLEEYLMTFSSSFSNETMHKFLTQNYSYFKSLDLESEQIQRLLKYPFIPEELSVPWARKLLQNANSYEQIAKAGLAKKLKKHPDVLPELTKAKDRSGSYGKYLIRCLLRGVGLKRN